MPGEPTWWYQSPGWQSAVLAPIAAVYGAVAARRMAKAPTYVSTLPVVCVGNFTAGGTGKTPTAALLVARLIARGRRPAILTRGYGGTELGPHWVDLAGDTAARVGDEPLLHARRATTMVARERVAGARTIEADGRADVIVMDDGLQNPSLAKTISIAVVDGARGLGNGRVIPAGPLRARLSVQLPRVDAILINGTGATAMPNFGAVPVLMAHLAPCEAVGAELTGADVVAYAGIGHPQRFFYTVRRLGARLVETVAFPDHHLFSAADAERLLALAVRHRGAGIGTGTGARLVTTEKDLARMSGLPALAGLAAASTAIPVEMQLDPGCEAQLSRLLDRLLDRDAAV